MMGWTKKLIKKTNKKKTNKKKHFQSNNQRKLCFFIFLYSSRCHKKKTSPTVTCYETLLRYRGSLFSIIGTFDVRWY